MKQFFEKIPSIRFEGTNSRNPLSFHHYEPDRRVGDKTMAEWLRFSVAYWHSFCATGEDMFGAGPWTRSWNRFSDPVDAAIAKADLAFEFFQKLGIKYFCAHDRDLVAEAETLRETNRRLDFVVSHIKDLMDSTGTRLLWGTSNLFYNPRYLHGAATTSRSDVFAYAAAQVKKMMEITLELKGENFVFWGGREGYETLLNTNMRLELSNMARFFSMAVEYAERIGFKGQLLIEPKPKEPTKHQYDYDAAHVIAFLKTFGLDEHFKLNIEGNHATLAGHTFQHELRYARIFDKLGSVDANIGDLLLGWDTDHFPTNLYDATLAMYEILLNGGLHSGGLNFDAHLRRQSLDTEDLFIAHIAGIDTFALGLILAERLINDGVFENFIKERYSSFDCGLGKRIVSGEMNFASLEEEILDKRVDAAGSGKQEYLERILNDFIAGGRP